MAVRKLSRARLRPGPAALALRLERAEAEQLARTGSPGPAGALPVAGGLAVSKGPRSQSSAAFGLGLAGRVSAEDLRHVEAHLGALGGAVRIELCAYADPSLAPELARRGYRPERFHQVLVREVDADSPAARPGAVPWADELEVREVRADEARAWVDAFAVAHLGAPPATEAEAEDLLAVPRTEGNACFAAIDRGAPVAVAVVSAHGGVALLSGAGVVPAWRGRGLQLALVEARLAWAARNGCELAACAVEPGGASQRTLEKAGFRVAYPKLVMVRAETATADAGWAI
jgi:GNAT superfamily N-acetyltransferase